MDDFTLRVRQIAQYPQLDFLGPSDLILAQQGGLGGGYVSVTVNNLNHSADSVSVGLHPPPNARGVVSSFLLTPLGARQGFGWYTDSGGLQRYLQNGIAGQWSLDGGDLSFSIAVSGIKDQPVLYWQPLLRLGYDGQLAVARQINVARDPIAEDEVATLGWTQRNTVASFDGRTGPVTLTPADLNAALCLEPCDQVASQSWVNTTICSSFASLVAQYPFVYTFNGRVGDITLTISDVEQAFFAQPGVYPTAPTPALGDASSKIATTSFVDESLDLWAAEINSSWNAADFELLNILQTQYAPINSPAFTGTPTTPMPPLNSSDASIPTTAWVMARIQSSVTGVVSWNGRTGVVTLTLADITAAGGAPINSPALTGTPTTPMAPGNDNSNQIASTAWVQSEIAAVSSGVTSFNGRSGIVTLVAGDITAAGGALLASPAFSGTPTAPTAAPGTSTTQLATTQFVMANVGVTSFNSRTGSVSLQLNDITAAGGAPLNNPGLTGVPTAPTAAPGTNTTQIASTAFVAAALGAGGIVNSFNGRTGTVTLSAGDVTGVSGALLSQGTAPPPSPSAQSLWFDTNGGHMYVYYSGVWVAV